VEMGSEKFECMSDFSIVEFFQVFQFADFRDGI
jgi:hypothetical protein